MGTDGGHTARGNAANSERTPISGDAQPGRDAAATEAPVIPLAARAAAISLPNRLAHMEPMARARTTHQLQRGIGNAAFQRLLATSNASTQRIQRIPPDGVVPPALATEDVGAKIEKAHQSLDPGDIKAIGRDNFGKASEAYRWDFIHALCTQGWVGPLDEYALEALWGLFGDGILEKAKTHQEDWDKSVSRDHDLLKLPAIQGVPDKFIADVRTLAHQYLDKNDNYAKQEMADLGENVPGTTGKGNPEARMAEIQQAAKLVRAAQEAQKALEQIVVGYDTARDEDSTPPPEGVDVSFKLPWKFQHGRPPFIPNKPPNTTHEEVDEQWLTLQTIIDGQQAKYPALYAVMQQGSAGDVNKVATDSPQAARTSIVTSLKALREHIAGTLGKVDGSLAYDLKPIHGQLMSGAAKGASNIDWANPVTRSIAKGVLEAKASQDFWVTLGLSSLAAAAFVIAEIGTLGLATPVLAGVGMGIGVGLAATSWEKAYTLAQASKASASKETELVAQGQATAAVVEAVLNTVMAFIDIKVGSSAAIKSMVMAADVGAAGAARALIVGLDRVGQMGAAEAAPLVERAIVEQGVETTVAKTSKSPQELLKIVGENSAVAQRLKDFMTLPEQLLKLTPEELGEKLALLPAEAAKDRKNAEALLQLAVERLGPLKALRRAGGWSVLAKAVGEQSAGIRSLATWRTSALADALDMLSAMTDEAVKSAGRSEADLAKQFLAARLGGTIEELGIGTAKPVIEGTGEADIARLLQQIADRRAVASRGLAGDAPMAKMAQEGAALKETWKTLSPEQRLGKLLELGNARLREIGAPEFKTGIFSPAADGAFQSRTWQLELRQSIVAQDARLDWLLEAVYHEARDAEQVAEVIALKKGEGWTAERIVSDMKVPDDVVSKIKPIAPDSPEGRQAAQWFESLFGAAKDARKATYAAMDEAFESWKLTARMVEAQKDETLKAGLRDIERERFSQYMREVNRYKALPEEADAYKIQAQFKDALLEHQRLLDEAAPATGRPGQSTAP